MENGMTPDLKYKFVIAITYRTKFDEYFFKKCILVLCVIFNREFSSIFKYLLRLFNNLSKRLQNAENFIKILENLNNYQMFRTYRKM